MEIEYIKVHEITPALEAVIEMVHDGWWADEPRIDWIAFLDRVETYGFDLGSNMDAAVIKQIKKLVKQMRK